MVILPDGVKIEMKWKSVNFIHYERKISFEIIPMFNGADIVIIPTKKAWSDYEGIVSFDEREEMIFLIEQINWKRDISIVEADVKLMISKEEIEVPLSGTIEATEAGRKIEKDYLFDPDQSLTKEQVKQIYCRLETRFAEQASGNVIISKRDVLIGSVLEKISIPTLQKNKNVNLMLLDS